MTGEVLGADHAPSESIRNLLARIAHLADLGDIDDYLACFTDDAVWELVSAEGLPLEAQVIRGAEAIRAGVVERRAAGIQGPGSFTAHAVSTTSITVTGEEATGEQATAQSLFMYYGGLNGTPSLIAVGRYTDTLRFVDGRWRLSHRRISRE